MFKLLLDYNKDNLCLSFTYLDNYTTIPIINFKNIVLTFFYALKLKLC